MWCECMADCSVQVAVAMKWQGKWVTRSERCGELQWRSHDTNVGGHSKNRVCGETVPFSHIVFGFFGVKI